MQKPSHFPKTKRPPTIFNRIEAKVAERTEKGQNIITLHVGDTYIDVPALMLQPAPDEDRLYGTLLNRYGDTFGDPPLREMLLEKVRSKNRLPVDGIDSIQITAGATAGLNACFSRLTEPGSEVLVLSPYWTILRQVADQAQVQIVEVPVFDLLASNENFDLTAQLEKYGGPWCKAIYFNSPSNPTGMTLQKEHLYQITAFAKKRDLWVFSDEAYEDFIYDDSKHISIGSLPGMFERTVSVYTFSKNFSTSGLRVGYTVAAPPVISEINLGVVGGYYHAGRFDQRMAWRGMKRFDECFKPLLDKYRIVWQWAKDNIKARVLLVSGGFYFFIWLGDDWKGIPVEKKIERMLDAGIVLAPGESFGADYNGWARMCFTIVPPEELKEAVERLNLMLN